MKVTITPRKPRNPLVAPARFRRAGAHRQAVAALRREARRELKRELDQMKPSDR